MSWSNADLSCWTSWSDADLSCLMSWSDGDLSCLTSWSDANLSFWTCWSDADLSCLMSWSDGDLSCLTSWSDANLSCWTCWSDANLSCWTCWSDADLSCWMSWSDADLSCWMSWSDADLSCWTVKKANCGHSLHQSDFYVSLSLQKLKRQTAVTAYFQLSIYLCLSLFVDFVIVTDEWHSIWPILIQKRERESHEYWVSNIDTLKVYICIIFINCISKTFYIIYVLYSSTVFLRQSI